MKRIPGSVLILSFISSLHAEPYVWRVESSASEVFEHEALHLTYQCIFDDEAMPFAIDLHPSLQTNNYRLERLSEMESVSEGRRVNRYEWVLFPKRSGDVNVTMTAIMRQTTQGSIENAIIGRDNVQDYQFSDTNISLPPVSVHVKPHKADLFGSYRLQLDVKKESVEAFEAIPVTVRLEGIGNTNRLDPFEIDIEGVHTFTDTPKQAFTLTPRGFKGSLSQRFALSSDQNFTIKPMQFTYFDQDGAGIKTLTTPQKNIVVRQAFSVDTLLDETDADIAERDVDLVWLDWLMVFISGAVTGWFLRRHIQAFWPKKIDASWQKRLEKSKKVSELMVILAMDKRRRFDALIKRAEKEKWALKRLKQEAKKLMKR